jgi:transcriptional regulator NrdR family protein
MQCPECLENTRVLETRNARLEGAYIIRRRRKCTVCGHAFTTAELDMSDLDDVVKARIRDTARIGSRLLASDIQQDIVSRIEAHLMRGCNHG